MTKLLASDGAKSDYFGISVSIDGEYAIIGAYGDEGNRVSGSAYVFKRNNTSWEEEANLTASSGTLFGISVSIDGDYAVVGTWGDNVAYIFKRDGTNWTQQAKLTGSDGNFGRSVSIDRDYTIVGSHGEDNYTGVAYIYKRDGVNWTQQARLTASDGAEIDCFGISVSISGDYAIIGARKAGAAYIFKRDGTSWTQQAKVIGIEDSFGQDVSIDGNYALVGEDVGNDWKGAVYVYKRNGTDWSEDAKLTASDGEKFAFFGGSILIDGEYIIVGSEGDTTENGGSSGSAYIFKCDGINWVEEAKLIASDGKEDDYFGTSVSIDGEHALIGAVYDDDKGTDSGSAYIFKKDQLPGTPTITGPNPKKPGVWYTLNFNVVDPDGDDVRYIIDWGDNTSDTTDFVESGINVPFAHAWDEVGTYILSVKAQDIYGAIGPEATKEIIIQKSKTVTNSLLLRFLERYPLLNLLFQRLTIL